MVKYEKFTLNNGLKVIVHQDKNTPIAVMNMLYDVGARDENPNKTGFAHLFEHLMFGGSINIPNYDGPLQMVGGENNAFTTNDMTNYYLSLPVQNLETGFWLESDRMLSLAFTEKSLEVQRSVVIEEFKQRYLNQPYGDVWLLLSPLAYKKHPYSWATIGKEISHIENATLQDVKDFFYKFYRPNNAILCVAGNVEVDKIKALAEKWFGSIKKGEVPKRSLPKEPKQTEHRLLEVERKVPANAIYKAYKMCDRHSQEYYTSDLISDVLSRGKSSRLYKELVKSKQIFSEINAYVSGYFDDGLFIIGGKINDKHTVEEADEAIQNVLTELNNNGVSETELTKVKNKVESTILFSEINVLDKAMNLAIAELLGDANLVNTEIDNYRRVTIEDIKEVSNTLFQQTNCSTLYYRKKK